MNTPNNKRRRESIGRIERAFVELLQNRELKEIRVSDICKMTNLNRSTFYANFVDVYDLADRIRDDLESEVYGMYEHVQTHDYRFLFAHMRENQLFYKTYFKLGYDDRHVIKLYDAARAEQDFGGRHLDYHIEFFRAGFNAIVKKWLAGGCVETPDELAEILESEYRNRA